MIKDRGLKAEVLKYVARRRWFPQLEVDVLPSFSTSRRASPITDVDVLALLPDEFVGYRSVVFDCKTRKNESPIARALWLAGLMDYLGASRGFIVIAKSSVPPDHRYFAAQRNILILTATDFEKYAEATETNGVADPGFVSNIDLWDRYYAIPQRFPRLERAVRFSKHGYWTSSSPGQACRRSIVQVTRAARELDPAHREHAAIFGDLASLFMHAVAKITAVVFPAHLQPETRDEMARALLMVLFGGREAYEYRVALQQNLPTGKHVAPEITLPHWDGLLQLMRNCLDAPNDAAAAPLLLREIAWSFLATDSDTKFAYARLLAAESRHAGKLALLGVEYLGKAASVPVEIVEVYTNLLLEIQSGA